MFGFSIAPIGTYGAHYAVCPSGATTHPRGLLAVSRRSGIELGGPIGTVMARRMVAKHEDRLRRLDPGAPCGFGDAIAADIEAWQDEVLRLGGTLAFACWPQ